MNIGIIGYGVVGSATGGVLSGAHKIYPYDKYKKDYNSEEGLKELVKNCQIVFICVSTPMKQSGEIDYGAIYDSLERLRAEIERQNKKEEEFLIIIRSTAVSGTADKLAGEYRFKFAVNPEFLTEKNVERDMKNTDRVIIGVEDRESEKRFLEVYKPIFPNARYIIVSRKEAEMIKYTANVLLIGQIALANEIYQICQALGIDYDIVKEAVLHDKRIGRNINVPGHDGNLGFGGKCFPKDLNALIYLSKQAGYNPELLEEVWRLNERVRTKKDWLDIPGATSENQNFDEG